MRALIVLLACIALVLPSGAQAQTPPPSGFLVPMSDDDDFEETPTAPVRAEPAKSAPKVDEKRAPKKEPKKDPKYDDVPAGFVVYEVESAEDFVESGTSAVSDDEVPAGFVVIDVESAELEQAPKPRSQAKAKAPKPPREPVVLPEGVGFGLTAGLGALLPADPRTGYTADFAYGLQGMWSPAFLKGLAADVGFWRAGRSDGTPVARVNTAFNHLSVRALYLYRLPQEPRLYVGGGGGALVTLTQVDYLLRDEGQQTHSSMAVRPGLDAGLVSGFQYEQIQVRLDVRSMLRWNLRLDFLATLSAGVAF